MKKFTAAALIAMASLALTGNSAEARKYHHRVHYKQRHHSVNMSSAYRYRNHSDGRPAAWCGWWMRRHLGIADRSFNLARNWARFGSAAGGPAPGVIGVQSHHVFKVLAVVGPGRVLAISGNDGHAVRARVRSTRGVIAWRSAN